METMGDSEMLPHCNMVAEMGGDKCRGAGNIKYLNSHLIFVVN